jgi:predicted nucleotidyltransferase component of viral defense system
MPDRHLVEALADDLGTTPGLVEKDWHFVRTIGAIAKVDPARDSPFSGGTSLSKGWELIKRFSEDIDFKVGEPPTESRAQARRALTAYRERVLGALAGAGFELLEKPVVGNESRFFSAALG